MSTGKLIFLRFYNVTFGRIRIFTWLLRKALLKMLIAKDVEKRYVASSKYFDFRELEIEKGNGSEPVE